MMSQAWWNHRANAVAWRSLLITMSLLVLSACGASKTVQTRVADYVPHSARILAVAPADELLVKDSGKLADAIGVELSRRGYTVVNTKAAAEMLTKHGVSPVDVIAPQGLAAFGKEGVDAVLSVTSSSADIGGPGMRYVKAKMTSTRTSTEIGGIDWTNSWGGMPGSPADYMTRKSAAAAAVEIADALAQLLG
jgi:hypothetical protein